jgi:hypothetical protein
MGKITTAVLVAVLLLVVASGVRAGTIVNVDQQNLAANRIERVANTGAFNGQSFRPTLGGLDAIEVLVRTVGLNTTMRLELLSGNGIGGSPVASSFVRTITSNAFSWVHFDFPTTVPLGTGLYTFRYRRLPGGAPYDVRYADFNPYSRGNGWSGAGSGTRQNDWDFAFRVGRHAVTPPPPPPSASTVPLPAAAWAGLGLLGLLGVVRRIRKR